MSEGSPILEDGYAHWWSRVRQAAPLAPSWVSVVVTRLLIAPGMRCDGLLIVADALDESSEIAEVVGEKGLATQLRRLADLPRELAPTRVDPED